MSIVCFTGFRDLNERLTTDTTPLSTYNPYFASKFKDLDGNGFATIESSLTTLRIYSPQGVLAFTSQNNQFEYGVLGFSWFNFFNELTTGKVLTIGFAINTPLASFRPGYFASTANGGNSQATMTLLPVVSNPRGVILTRYVEIQITWDGSYFIYTTVVDGVQVGTPISQGFDLYGKKLYLGYSAVAMGTMARGGRE